jgi:uncharacterized protein YuzE
MIFADLDRGGRLLGVEFVNADEFVPFLKTSDGPSDVANHLEEAAMARVG